ncbi:MAG: acetate--CoA ligase family protein [Gammaproteobacteria bacterium]|jgi:acetate---CoA ligase (ADP-forming) subunit beta|nr:acetate--CoA ligase family protein [Gammaproteobacteria bacterium]MBT5204685.1 acetate--CoA ligase family protein [Gammaproteobacteria bacterium]MBT5601973.1 acetate--CoA ligase family protein [Gammaproteobacteria bacterium]MBT6243892.1 acetate--CoA ligase family protein [Gammaproteobacteria bacterium]
MNFESVVELAHAEGRDLLNEVEAKQLLAQAGVPVVETVLASSVEEAKLAAEKIGYPVVVKVVSADISHKSDVGGVKIGLADAEEVSQAYQAIMENSREAVPDAVITGVAVQGMASEGIEVIVGMVRDPQFGPVMMFGLGGIFVELLKDVSFRVLPLAERDARQMIDDIKGQAILDGVRGQAAADKTALCQLILKVGQFIEQHPEIQELDMNPVFAYAEGAVAVDARIVLHRE